MRLFIAAITLSVCGFAQEFRATISGRVTDAAGAAVANARVEIKSRDTGELSMTLTSEEGTYQVSFLIPGNYVVTVEKPGFKKTVREGVRLEIAQHGVLDLELALGEVTQSVTVSENLRALETESADRGATFESRRVLEVPLMGRNPFSQAWSSPGVVQNASTQRLRPFDIAGSSSMVIGGGRPSANEVLVDGVSSLFQASSVSYVPTAEAMSEFKVQTTNFDAQYGWTLGGVVNIITKNGTNQFHGSVFEFLQNTHLNANTFNKNLTGVGALFVAHQHLRRRRRRAHQEEQTIFHLHLRRHPAGDSRSVCDLDSDILAKTGRLFADLLFARLLRQSAGADDLRSLLDHSRIERRADTDSICGQRHSILAPGSDGRKGVLLPAVEQRTGRSAHRAEQPDQQRQHAQVHRLLPREHRSGGLQYQPGHTPVRALLAQRPARKSAASTTPPPRPSTPPTRATTIRSRAKTTTPPSSSPRRSARRWCSTFAPGWSDSSPRAAPTRVRASVRRLSASPPPLSRRRRIGFPKFNWANYEGAGAQPTYASPIAQTNSFQVIGGEAMGRDNVKFGGEFRWIRGYSQNAGFKAGNFSFDQLFTGANPAADSPSSGNSLASFLLGTPQSGFIQVNSQPARQEKLFSLFLQNDIRAHREAEGQPGSALGLPGAADRPFQRTAARLRLHHATTRISPAGFPVHGGAALLRSERQSARHLRFVLAQLRAASRRGVPVGRAHRAARRLRAGLRPDLLRSGQRARLHQTTNMVTSIQAGVPANTLDNPFPTGILQPVGSSLGLLTALGQSYQFADPAGGRPPFVHQFSFEIQRELPERFSGFGRLRWQPFGPDSGHPTAQRAAHRSPRARHGGFVAERAQPLRRPFARHVAERRHRPAAAATGPVPGVSDQWRNRGVPADRKVQLQLCANSWPPSACLSA